MSICEVSLLSYKWSHEKWLFGKEARLSIQYFKGVTKSNEQKNWFVKLWNFTNFSKILWILLNFSKIFFDLKIKNKD